MPLESPHAWPTYAGWLAPELPVLQRAIVLRAFCDVATCEDPPSSNHGGRIDEYNRRAGAPLGSYWCASWATACWIDAGADMMLTGRASCENIRRWALGRGTFTTKPSIGSFVLYGTRGGTAEHIGIIARTVPYLISIEGNTSWGGVFSRNGEVVLPKRPDLARVLGYVVPRPRTV